MKEARDSAAAAHHKDKGFIITGGYSDNGRLSSTEITKDGLYFEDFTPLPIALSSHCMVALNEDDDGDFFVAGGWTGNSYSKRVFIHKGDHWNEMTEMPTARSGKKPSLEMENELICLIAHHCRPHVWPCQGKPRGKGGKDCGCRWVCLGLGTEIL